jgi:glycosyltransferase involved in cell wall biosynthesis
MMFSVLLPTRNRLELLRYAIESVRRQDYRDWEIVVSDNDSTEDVRGYVASLADTRIRYFRAEHFVPVTENWNNALAHSSGSYVVMLGDDDCLLPGYFSAMHALIERFREPDALYCEALQFAYPGVMPGHEKGFVQTSYSEILPGRGEPFLLDRRRAIAAVRKSMSLWFSFSYNMQHSLIRRSFIDSLAAHGPFFQSPYPDYYASNVLLLTAETVVAVPRPLVGIGISPKSFGYYYFNNRAEEGSAFLNNLDRAALPAAAVKNLLPGNPLLGSWYLAMACIEANYGGRFGVKANADRYRLVKILLDCRSEGLSALRRHWRHLTWGERLRFTAIATTIHLLLRSRPRRWGERLFQKYNPFPVFDPGMRQVEYKNILELYESMVAAA